MWATSRGCTDAIRELVAGGADRTLRDDDGRCAMDYATHERNMKQAMDLGVFQGVQEDLCVYLPPRGLVDLVKQYI